MILKAGINKLSIILLLCFSGIPFPARAADFDGSTPVFCAITRMLECQKKSGCEQVFPEEAGLPTFLKIDFKNRVVSGISTTEDGKPRTTEIKSIQRDKGHLILQGFEIRAWSVTIGEKTGKMTMAVAGEEDGFVLFGTCVVP